LQQDAFDVVDVSTPMDRQQAMLQLLRDVTEREFMFDNKEEARGFFVRLTSSFRNLNYSASDSSDYAKFLSNIQLMLTNRKSDPQLEQAEGTSS
jgi:V/A-type H+-transporting ATPase subunit A